MPSAGAGRDFSTWRCSALPQLNGRGQRVAQTGVAAGLLIGPVALGTLANTSWSLMWLVAGCAALLGAAVILVAAARCQKVDSGCRAVPVLHRSRRLHSDPCGRSRHSSAR